MPTPATGVLTERLYGRLPELYRAADAGLDWPLLRFLSGLLDQASDVEELLDGFDPTVDGVSTLVDPATAEPAWLPWLAQLVGLDVTDLTVPEARNLISTPEAGWLAGSTAALVAAAKAALTGTQTVRLVRQDGGDPWRVSIRTYTGETPDPAAVERIVAAHKPAGVVFDLTVAGPSWDELVGTWDDLAGLTWDDLANLPPA